MTSIRSFNDTMALDRGILDTLNMPAGMAPLPESKSLVPPGALRGVMDDGVELTALRTDPLLNWIMETPSHPSVLTPSGFQSALGHAAGGLSAAAREAAGDAETQSVLRGCTRLIAEQLELIKLADFNRSALMQG